MARVRSTQHEALFPPALMAAAQTEPSAGPLPDLGGTANARGRGRALSSVESSTPNYTAYRRVLPAARRGRCAVRARRPARLRGGSGSTASTAMRRRSTRGGDRGNGQRDSRHDSRAWSEPPTRA
eukprot:5939909-Prymnesium_polylepis.1